MAHISIISVPSMAAQANAAAIERLLAKLNRQMAQPQAPESLDAIRLRLKDLVEMLDR